MKVRFNKKSSISRKTKTTQGRVPVSPSNSLMGGGRSMEKYSQLKNDGRGTGLARIGKDLYDTADPGRFCLSPPILRARER
jgi:hypothetical protein